MKHFSLFIDPPPHEGEWKTKATWFERRLENSRMFSIEGWGGGPTDIRLFCRPRKNASKDIEKKVIALCDSIAAQLDFPYATPTFEEHDN